MAKEARILTKALTGRARSTRKPMAKTMTAPAGVTHGPIADMVARHDDVARRAFELYMARGATDGDALGDWVQAERELSAMQ